MKGMFTTLAIIPVVVVGVSDSKAETKFSSSFKWCPQIYMSPQFTVRGIPKGTKKLEFNMIDHNAAYQHGGGTVEYHGQRLIPCGAFDGWTPPSPPGGQIHTYEFDIKALDASGNELGVSSSTRECCQGL